MAAKNVIRELLVRLGVTVDPATKQDIKKYEQAIDRIKGQVEDLAGAALGAGAALAGMLLGAATAAGVLAVETGEAAERIERQARALNMTRAEYQEISHVFETFGSDGREIGDVFAQLAQKSIEAADGAEQTIKTWKMVGITADQLKGKRPIELFELLADATSKATDRTRALAGVSALLGEDSAKKLLPVLAQGVGVVRDLRQESHALGLVMRDDQMRAAKQAAVEWRKLKGVATGLRHELGIALAPAVTSVLRGLLGWVQANRELLTQRIEFWVRNLVRAVLLLDDTVRFLFGKDRGWERLMINLATGAGFLLLLANLEKVEKALGAIRLVATFLWTSFEAGVAAASIPLIPFVALLAGLAFFVGLAALGVDDFLTFWRGGQSVLGDNLDLIERYVPAFGAVRELARAVIDLVAEGFENVDRLTTALKEGLAPAFEALDLALGPVLRTLERIWAALNAIAAAPISGAARFVRGLTAESQRSGVSTAAQVQAGVSGAVTSQVLQPAARAGFAADQSVRSVVQENRFYGPSAQDVNTALESAFRRAQLAVYGGGR